MRADIDVEVCEVGLRDGIQGIDQFFPTDKKITVRWIEKSLDNFLKILHANQNGYRILVRWSKGQDIEAGCGQLIYKGKIA